MVSAVAFDGFAQQGQQSQQPQKVEKIEVTGSNIKRTDDETPSVVQIITREQIERSGSTSVAELLRDIPATAGGSAQDFGAGSGFQRGNQTASLRGLGSVATLVLLNGRRLSPAPYADPNLGQGSSYNLNSIPITAIERIEVLKDGASAIYGSDAIAGVINVILRKDYKGAQATVNRWQATDKGNYVLNQASAAAGVGDLAKDRWNVLVTGEYSKREPVWVRDSGSGIRNDAYQTLDGRGLPNSSLSYPANRRRENVAGSGVFNVVLPVNPACPPELRIPSGSNELCLYNTWNDTQVVSANERSGVLTRGTIALSANVIAFAEAGYTKNEGIFVGAPPALDAASPSTWFSRDGQRNRYTLALPVGHPDNPNPFALGLRYRFADLGQSSTKVVNDYTRFVAGLSGTWENWDWESAFLTSSAKRTETARTSLFFPALTAAVSSGSYRFDGARGPNSPELLASLMPEYKSTGDSNLTSLDLKGTRELMRLPGGPLAIAAGAEVRREKMDIVPDSRIVAGQFVGLGSSAANGSRDVYSLYAELSAPIVKNLETQVAARYDHYSDFGSSFTPKVGAKFNVTDGLAFRGSAARGFRAPSLFQISDSNVQAFNSGIRDPLRCPVFNTANEDCSRTISTLIQANTNLEPEKSTSGTLGVILAVDRNWSGAIDYWYIHRTNFIDRFDSGTVIRNEFNPAFTGGTVQRDPNPATWLPGVPNSGPILSTIRRFDNFGGTATRGADLDISGRISLNTWGRLDLHLNATYIDEMKWQLGKGEVPYVDGAGNFYVYETPRVRGVFSATWTYQAFDVFTRYNYTGSWYLGDPTVTGGLDGASCYNIGAARLAYIGSCQVKSWRTVDMGVTWRGIKDLSVLLLVRNVGNIVAPYDPYYSGFNPVYHNPYGRYLQAGVTYKFK